MTGTEIELQLKKLQLEFAANLPNRIDEVDQYWSDTHCASAAEQLFCLGNLQRAVHLLAGSGASFGFPITSEVAAGLDDRLQDLQSRGEHLSVNELAEIDSQVGRMVRAIQAELETFRGVN